MKLQIFQFLSLISLSVGIILEKRQTPAGASNGIGPQVPPSGLKPAKIPQLGLGTFSISSVPSAKFAVSVAFANGIRHVDTATIYRNEEAIGTGIQYALQKNNLKREDIWVTTKLWNSNHQNPEIGLHDSLRKLNLSYVDLYLMHFPAGSSGQGGRASFDHVETWKRMEKLIKPEGPVRFIGVSNFSPAQMEELLAVASIRPAVHQIELHPYLPQTTFLDWHRKQHIPVTGYAPLANTSPYYADAARENGTPPLLTHPIIREVAAARKCSPAQVVLAWNMKRGVAVIPKAVQEGHIKENSKAFECQLTNEDSIKINGISSTNLGRFNNPCKKFRVQCYQGLEVPTQGV